MLFAVKNKLMIGNADKDLMPGRKLTRGELATMMVRLLGARTKGDLSAYTDVSETAWYYEDMSAAVHLGIFKGTTATTLSPSTCVTRQEVFTAFARTLGLVAADEETYRVYVDSRQIAPYARNAVSVLTERGILQGVGGGKLSPTAYITREETAQMFRNLLDDICDDPAEVPETGRILYRGRKPLPADLQLDGDLIIGCGIAGEQTLEGLEISGMLLLRCVPQSAVTVAGGTVGELIVAAPLQITADAQIDKLLVSADGAEVLASASALHSAADAHVTGDFTNVDITSGTLTLEGDVAEQVTIHHSAAGEIATFHGQIKEIQASGNDGIVQGEGYAENIYLHGKNITVTLAHGEKISQPDYGLEGLKISLTGTASITIESPTLTAKAVFTGFQAGWGCAEGGRKCDLYWYLGSNLIREDKDFFLKEGATSSCTYTIDVKNTTSEQQTLRLEVVCKDEKVAAVHPFVVQGYAYYYRNALNLVETVKVEVVALRNTKLYTNSSLSRSFRNIPAGTVMSHYYYPGGSGTQVNLADGTFGWIPYRDVQVSTKDYTQKMDYHVGAKEGFVEKKGYSSTTGYLIWVSLKTQRVNIFKGKQGDWTLIKTCLAATGKNTTPTIGGVYKITYRHETWRFYGPNYTVFEVTGYYQGHAFHTRPHRGINDRNGELVDPNIGTPRSQGCIRLYDEDAKYIYGLPMGTTIVIY